MSFSLTNYTRVVSGIKSALKALIEKLGGTVSEDAKIDTFADLVNAMTLTAMKPSAHAATHKTGGADAITPSDIGAAASSHNHNKADITDFPSVMAPTAHKDSHKTGGADALSPGDIGAASASHTHTKSDITDLASSPAPIQVTLTVAGWTAITGGFTQSVAVAGLLATDDTRTRIDPVRSATDISTANDEAFARLQEPGAYVGCEQDGYLFCRVVNKPTSAIALWVTIGRW